MATRHDEAAVKADGRSRPRRDTDAKIEAAVRAIIAEGGVRAVTMERVSDRSGVARTTLYRRFRNRFELLNVVAERVAPLVEAEVDLSRAGFTTLLEHYARTLADADARTLVGQMLATADDDFLTEWRARFYEPRTSALRGFLERGIASGLLREDADDDAVIQIVAGTMLIGVVHGGTPMQVAELADRLWLLIAA